MSAGEHFINGQWAKGAGAAHSRRDPALGSLTWEGALASVGQVGDAAHAARQAAPAWAAMDQEKRAALTEAFAKCIQERRIAVAEAISMEAGKPLWESNTEVDAMIGKVALTRQAFAQRRAPERKEQPGVTLATRYKPHGVLGVIGPFNFPGHVPNGHIIPALLAGNTIIFKPSELTPRVAKITMQCWEAAQLPPGVINMVQGTREAGAALAGHAEVDGILFTGGRTAGVALSKMFATQPEKMLALELGGNNPLVMTGVKNLDAAAYAVIQSAFITAGQRCTCARRLIVPEREADALIDRLVPMMKRIVVGPYTQRPEPFMGPVISAEAAGRIIEAQTDLVRSGAKVIRPVKRDGDSALLTPGLLDVTAVADRSDEEIFGPLLQLIRVPDFAAAITEANDTKYGLAAGLLSDDRATFEQFYSHIRAGIVHWNRPTTGASGALAFGGIGASGNHRPSGFFAADYCSDPVAVIEVPALTMPATLSPGIKL